MTVGSGQLVGREEELALLLGLLDPSDRSPAVGAIAGEAGIGKTALWLAALDAARMRGYAVLSCRPSQAETRFSFSGLADLIGGTVPQVLPTLPLPQRRALEAALSLADAEGPVEHGVLAFAFLSAIRHLAQQHPVLLTVDDVQWLDAPSLALLRYAVPRLAGEPVAVLLTARGDVPSWLRREAPGERLLDVELGPLSVGAVHELLRARLEVALPRPLLLRIWSTSGGNPFFALELTRALRRRGGTLLPGEELPLPPSLEQLVHERVAGLGAAARQVASVVAALAEPTLTLVEQASGDAFEPGLTEALEAGVLELEAERLRFTHPLLGSAISSRSPPPARRSLHRDLARLAPDLEERARHLALAARGTDAEAAAALEAAAHAAHARGAPAVAAELAGQALRLTAVADARSRHRRLLSAADLAFEAGDVEGALAVLEHEGADAPDGRARAAVLFRVGRLRAETSGAEEAVALFRQALEAARGDDALEASILLQLGQFARFTEDAEQALRYLESAVEAAARVDDDELSCRVLGAYSLVHFNAGRGIAEQAIDRALALEASLAGRSRRFVATPFLVHQLVWSGELRRSRRLLEEWYDWAAARDHADAAEAQWYLALLEWRAGNWEAARLAAAATVTLSEQFGREATTISAFPSAVLAAHCGDADRARQLAERGLSAPGCPDVARAGFEWVLGFVELSDGDARRALEHLSRAAQLISTLRILEPSMLWYVPDLLDALLALGQIDRAEESLAPWEERARALDRSWALAVSARTRALVRAARGDLEGSLADFEEAFAEHARTPDPFQHGRTLLALGATQRRAKRRRLARATLEQTVAGFERLPAPLWAQKARAELARIGGRAPSRGELTEGERRVAEFVAEGRSNREAAAELFLTEHSVETVLSRVYRKLGIRSRAELARRLSEAEEPRANS